MDVSYDGFIRTTDDYHVAAVQKIFKSSMTRVIFIRLSMRLVLYPLRKLLD